MESQTQSQTSWKEILAFTFAGGVLWFMLKPKGDEEEQREQHEQNVLALTQKTQSAFSEDFYAKLLTQEHYAKIEDYLKKINLTKIGRASCRERV